MSATPRPWKLVQYSTGLYVVDATGRTMAVAAVDRADQGKAVDEIRASLAVAVLAVNTFDEAKAALEELVGAVEAVQAYQFPKAFSALGIDPLGKAKAVLAKMEDPHA